MSHSTPPMDVWSWISQLPSSDASWPESEPTLELASCKGNDQNSFKKSILLKAERSSIASLEDEEALLTFSISLEGFNPEKTLWVSNPCSLFSKPFLPLLLQLLQETISFAPTFRGSTIHGFQIDAGRFSRYLNSLPSEQLSSIYNLVFLCRLFWLCVFDTPAEVGSLYFELLSSSIKLLSCNSITKASSNFIGCDGELYFMRSLGYILSKWLILKGLQSVPFPAPPSPPLGFSYAKASHGLMILKAYTPVLAMDHGYFSEQQHPYKRLEAKECLLKYALGHQQLEAVIQFEYTISSFSDYVKVSLRVDNFRLHVTRLRFGRNEDKKGSEFMDERHFPSRVRIWVGPEAGSTYVTGLSLGRSTGDNESEIETQRTVTRSLGNSKLPSVKSKTKTTAKTRMRNWRWDQDSEGNLSIFDAVLCDNFSRAEVSSGQPLREEDSSKLDSRNAFRKRYCGASRAFTKRGGVVFAGDEYGEEVCWRLDKELEGSVVKWRLGGTVWLTYWPNEFKTTYSETRCVEWCEDIELPLLVCQ